jgi:hypothetical protein
MPLPAPPGLPVLHRRTHDVTAYRVDLDEVLLRGILRDDKPAGVHVPGDPDPLTIHHIAVDVVFRAPAMTITAVEVAFDQHPHTQCPRIADHYRSLVGSSITRGFTNRVRDLFGGPRGCSHTSALLIAMGPVALQSMWTLDLANQQLMPVDAPRRTTGMSLEERWRRNVGSCHVWAEGTDFVQAMVDGGPILTPDPILRRADTLGVPHAAIPDAEDRPPQP